MVTILMMSAKLATPGFLKIKMFRNKDYNVIIPDYSNYSNDSNNFVDLVM